MKVLGINGSPRGKGNTALALGEMQKEFARHGIEMEIVHIGNKAIRGCLACGACSRNRNEKCIIDDDPVNDIVGRMKAADAIVLGSPVHYANIAGTMKSFCDRAFYVAGANYGIFAGKPGAAVVAVRRSGGSNAWSALNYYFTIANMPVAASTYWSIVHGTAAGEATEDAEGLQTVRNAARGIVSLLTGAPAEFEFGARTSFIR